MRRHKEAKIISWSRLSLTWLFNFSSRLSLSRFRSAKLRYHRYGNGYLSFQFFSLTPVDLKSAMLIISNSDGWFEFSECGMHSERAAICFPFFLFLPFICFPAFIVGNVPTRMKFLQPTVTAATPYRLTRSISILCPDEIIFTFKVSVINTCHRARENTCSLISESLTRKKRLRHPATWIWPFLLLHLFIGTVFYWWSVVLMFNFRTNVLEILQKAWRCLILHFLWVLQASYCLFTRSLHALVSPGSSYDILDLANVADIFIANSVSQNVISDAS